MTDAREPDEKLPGRRVAPTERIRAKDARRGDLVGPLDGLLLDPFVVTDAKLRDGMMVISDGSMLWTPHAGEWILRYSPEEPVSSEQSASGELQDGAAGTVPQRSTAQPTEADRQAQLPNADK